jgi:hypothetical protein
MLIVSVATGTCCAHFQTASHRHGTEMDMVGRALEHTHRQQATVSKPLMIHDVRCSNHNAPRQVMHQTGSALASQLTLSCVPTDFRRGDVALKYVKR